MRIMKATLRAGCHIGVRVGAFAIRRLPRGSFQPPLKGVLENGGEAEAGDLYVPAACPQRPYWPRKLRAPPLHPMGSLTASTHSLSRAASSPPK